MNTQRLVEARAHVQAALHLVEKMLEQLEEDDGKRYELELAESNLCDAAAYLELPPPTLRVVG
jgi:hypothetical protein